MKLNEVTEGVEKVKKLSRDAEAAHSEEDKLYEKVLGAIANGKCDNPSGCALEVLKTKELHFPRYCA